MVKTSKRGLYKPLENLKESKSGRFGQWLSSF
jgi:hypothetical protein